LKSLELRISENRQLLLGLEEDSKFQNIMIFMLQEVICDEKILSFLTGQVSLEECLGKKTWIINLLLKSYDGLEVRSGWFGEADSHFLSRTLANNISGIFKPGIFEAEEKTRSKTRYLIKTINTAYYGRKLDFHRIDASGANLARATLQGAKLAEANFQKADLSEADFRCNLLKNVNFEGANLTKADFRGADLVGVNFKRANLSGANFLEAKISCADFSGANVNGVKTTDPTILKEQAFEKYKLLPLVLEGVTFQGNGFPLDLINEIGRNLFANEK
jgi:hypothetical protein